ncbi:hypothetical protein HMPREF9442_00527, partial [Paraprevotella xylaniphila YIT 11841]
MYEKACFLGCGDISSYFRHAVPVPIMRMHFLHPFGHEGLRQFGQRH